MGDDLGIFINCRVIKGNCGGQRGDMGKSDRGFREVLGGRMEGPVGLEGNSRGLERFKEGVKWDQVGAVGQGGWGDSRECIRPQLF